MGVAAPPEGVKEFVDEYGLTFPVLLDPEGEISRVLQTIGVPATFVLDREGVVRFLLRYEEGPDALEQAARAVLRAD